MFPFNPTPKGMKTTSANTGANEPLKNAMLKKTKPRWGTDSFSKFLYVFLGLCLAIIVTSAIASNPLSTKLERQMRIVSDEMDHLKEQNDKYRSELSVLDPRVIELKNLINTNKTKWTKLSGKRENLLDVVSDLKGLEETPIEKGL
jgi:hypothetical protein